MPTHSTIQFDITILPDIALGREVMIFPMEVLHAALAVVTFRLPILVKSTLVLLCAILVAVEMAELLLILMIWTV